MLFHYNGGSFAPAGFGLGSGDKDALIKALNVGYPTPGAAPGTFAPATIESLDSQITSVAESLPNIKFVNRLAAAQAINTVHQYVKQTSVGSRLPGWQLETSDPSRQSTPEIERVIASLMLMVDYFRVGDVANMVSIISGAGENADAFQQRNALINHLSHLEDALFNGDQSMCSLEIDGLRTLMLSGAPSTNIVDLRGQAITGANVNAAQRIVTDKFGRIEEVWMSGSSQESLGNLAESNLIYNRPSAKMGGEGTTINVMPTGANTTNGFVKFESSAFLQAGGVHGNEPLAAGEGDSKPTLPVIGVAPAAGAHASSQFVAADAGDYYYKVVAYGPGGISVPVSSAVVSVAAGDRVTMTMTDNAITNVYYYKVYRSDKNGLVGTCKFAFNFAKAAVGNTTIIDYNDDIPGTTTAYGLAFDPSVLQYVHLGQRAWRKQLAEISLYKHFAIISLSVLLAKAPSKLFMWRNCGAA